MYLWGGTNIGEGSRGPPRPLVGPGQSPGWGFRGGEAPRSKMIFNILNGSRELSCVIFLAYFNILRVYSNASEPLI